MFEVNLEDEYLTIKISSDEKLMQFLNILKIAEFNCQKMENSGCHGFSPISHNISELIHNIKIFTEKTTTIYTLSKETK